MNEDDDSTAEETRSMKFFIFTKKKKLLMIHPYIEGHNSSNSKQSLKSTCENNIRTSLFSENLDNEVTMNSNLTF